MKVENTAPGDSVVLSCDQRRDAVLNLIRGAHSDLALSVFRCDDFAILDALADAVDRKVRVRALMTQTAKNWDKKLRELETVLVSTGATVRRYMGPLTKYHAKYIVADCGQAMVASLNLTRKCFDQTCDFVALTGDLPVVTSLLRLFEHDWNQINGLPAELNPRLIVGPQQGRTQLTRLLESARRHIRMTDHRLSDPRVLKVLRLQQDSGVSVEVLGDGAFPGLIPHGRMFLVDDAIAVIGSFALTPPSLDDRREVALILDDPEIVQSLIAWFDRAARRRPPESLRLAEFTGFDPTDDDE